jgi:hypothetical protein
MYYEMTKPQRPSNLSVTLLTARSIAGPIDETLEQLPLYSASGTEGNDGSRPPWEGHFLLMFRRDQAVCCADD